MTKEEALKKLRLKYEAAKDFTDVHWEACERREHREYVEMLKRAIEALEKQIPKKPIVDKRYTSECCPRCNNFVRLPTGFVISAKGKKMNFCCNCGQALDWSEECVIV